MHYLFEVTVGAVKFQMFAAFSQTSAVFDDFLQADTFPNSGADGTFSPRCIDHLVSLSSVLVNLLNTSGSTALNRDSLLHARKYLLVFQLRESELLWFLDQTIEFKKIIFCTDIRDASVIAHEVQRVRCYRLRGNKTLKNRGQC